MADYKVLVQEKQANGSWLSVYVHEVRDAASQGEAVARFLRGYDGEMTEEELYELSATAAPRKAKGRVPSPDHDVLCRSQITGETEDRCNCKEEE